MLSKIHDTLRSKIAFTWFTWFTRLLLFVAFLPSGYKKLAGYRFTSLGIDNPVGFFFEALYQSGIYWNFLGAFQLTAATLLLIPRTATLGAILYLPILTNIFVIVTAMNFSGTPVVTGLMLVANLYLLVWDYPKVKAMAQLVVSR